jgi:hypothetical protein
LFFVRWTVFAIFLLIGLAINGLAAARFKTVKGVVENQATQGPWEPSKTDLPVLLSIAATICWMLFFGIPFAKSIYGTGDSGLSADGPSYLTSKNPLEPVMFLVSGTAAVGLAAGIVLIKKRPGARLAAPMLRASVWLLTSNFLAYILGCTVYETILKK